MKIGIIGLGVVGNAHKFGLKKLGHNLLCYDKKIKNNWKHLLKAEVIFICLPTQNKKNIFCDTRHIDNYIDILDKENYKGIIVIKSTVTPGFTDNIIKKYVRLKICHSPEFLRERFAKNDFINKNVLVIGTKDTYIFKKIKKIHGDYAKAVERLSPTESELLKYYANGFAGLRVVFANIIFELSKKLGCKYDKIKKCYIKTKKASDHYLDVNKNFRGYGGNCLPKDIEVLNNLIYKHKLSFKLIRSIIEDNKKFKITIPKGMRRN